MKGSNAAPPVIVISGHGTIETAVSAVKAGAADYLTKPLDFVRLRDLLAVRPAARARLMYATDWVMLARCAAAERYFTSPLDPNPLRKITLPQAALLAGLIQSPSRFAPAFA